ncbi:MAG: VOC family protein [Elusimicrobia bacterium]|nr:VOC family protein [Elusimicrobiota bacterium]
MKLNNIRLMTNKFDETFSFYSKTLGFEVTWGAPGETYAHFKAPGGGELSLFSRKAMAEALGTERLPAAAAAQDGFALILEVPSVDGVFNELSAKGVKFLTTPEDRKDWGIRTAHLRDPEGNLLELISDLPREQWSKELNEEAKSYVKE